MKVEEHNGTAWQTQSEMRNDGLDNRLETTSYTDEVGETIRYQLDNGHIMVLVAYDPGNVYKNQVYEWGFINSWNVGREIWWLRDRDVKSLWLDIVEIKK